MGLKTSVERELWGRWVTISRFREHAVFSNLLNDFKGDNLLGYVYVDHDAGTTLDVVKLFDRDVNGINITADLVVDKIRVILRFEQFADVGFDVVHSSFTGNEAIAAPPYMDVYSKPNLDEFRQQTIFDELRADGFPDDIRVLFMPADDSKKTELVWGRVENYDHARNTGVCTLLVQPHQNFGISKGQPMGFSLVDVDGKNYAIAMLLDSVQQQHNVRQKPWWKFW